MPALSSEGRLQFTRQRPACDRVGGVMRSSTPSDLNPLLLYLDLPHPPSPPLPGPTVPILATRRYIQEHFNRFSRGDRGRGTARRETARARMQFSLEGRPTTNGEANTLALSIMADIAFSDFQPTFSAVNTSSMQLRPQEQLPRRRARPQAPQSTHSI